MEIFDKIDPDVCLLAETMTMKTKLEGCKSVNPTKSVGQNVAIMVRKNFINHKVMKIYEPNVTINMMGIRLKVKNAGIRIYTAHLKQLSTNTRSEITDQFEEIRSQFREANKSQEGMLLVFDSNVHVGSSIKGCMDKQDWGGKLLCEIISEENLMMVNDTDTCEGIVTRVDPRNGNKSTLDLALCNYYMTGKIKKMEIDEKGLYKPTKYGKDKVTSTDHNTIILNLVVEKSPVTKIPTFLNTKNKEGRELFVQNVESSNSEELFSGEVGCVNTEFAKLMRWWEELRINSFRKVSRNKHLKSGICEEVKGLMDRERWIKSNVMQNPERGRLIAEVRKEIRRKICCNNVNEMKELVEKVQKSSNPHAEVFKIRRRFKDSGNVAFPLKDEKGNLQVEKSGIDDVIMEHFSRVFHQIDVPEGDVWVEYWSNVDKIYKLLQKFNKYGGSTDCVPQWEDIMKLIKSLDAKKAVRGDMNIDLVKLGGEKVWNVIFRCIQHLAANEELPMLMRIENMVLLYKHAGEIYKLDNYRGIFLRHIILSIYQKWLYSKCAPVVDSNGTEYAFGGRVGRSVQEALLIVKLIQDHVKWTGSTVFIKFMDVQKFFDTMNFKKALLDAHLSGVRGKAWNLYDINNKFKTCIPVTPLGSGTPIDVKEVFVQGSTDAVLMAWNTMDCRNKKRRDVFDPVFVIEGIDILGLTFVDDILEVLRSKEDVEISLVSDEVFEKESRLKFKPPKCKIMTNTKVDDEITFVLDNQEVEIVHEHTHLGTMVEMKSRNKDIEKRIKEAQGVMNEIVLICKSSELSLVRLIYVNMLIESCLCSKITFGCEMWDELPKKNKEAIDDLKAKVIKRTLELPYSTPSTAIKYEFGLVDLSLEVAMDKILLAVKVLISEEGRIARRLLSAMLGNSVPGFCSHVQQCCEMFGVKLLQLTLYEGDVRELLKRKVVKIQEKKLCEQMMLGSKTDQMLLNRFSFDGKMKEYLIYLPFEAARMVFMVRSRMLCTKDNYPGRWIGNTCNVCGCLDTDKHLFGCPGYSDLIDDGVTFKMFILLDSSMDELYRAAMQMINVNERLKVIQEVMINC